MERMKRTSNKVLNYPGHIDCRNSSLDSDKLEWESKLSVKLRAIGLAPLLRRVATEKRSNLNSNYLVKVIND